MPSIRLKLRTGNTLSTTWPEEVLARLGVKEGDELLAVETQHGILVTRYDPSVEKAMDAARKVMDRDHDALEDLSRR